MLGGGGVSPNLMQDEQIVYRTSAGKFSFSRYLPASTVIATNKRLIIYKPIRFFSKQRVFYYDRIESVGVRKGFLASTLVIKTESEERSRGVLFYNSSKLISIFGVVSNQLRASKDPHYAEKLRAHSLDTRYAVLKSEQTFVAPDRKSEVQLSGFIRPSEEEPALAQRAQVFEIQKPALDTVVQGPKVQEKTKPRQTLTLGINTVLSITQRLHGYINSAAFKPERAEIAYSAPGGELLKPESTIRDAVVQGVMELPRSRKLLKPKEKRFDPDKELKIFRIRKLRAGSAGNTPGKTQFPYQFNLFNTK